MLESLAQKRVVVTAAATGIGHAIARGFLDAGARVHVCDIDAGALAAFEAPGLGATVADVADEAAVDRLFDDALGRLGGLDVLINNAGVAGPTGAIETLDAAEWRRTMAVNLDSQFYCLRRAVPQLKQAGGGSIVNLSSTAGIFGFPLRAPYAASKWAVVGLTKTLAMELGPFAIRVNAICPGPVEGARIDRVIAAAAAARGESIEVARESMTERISMRSFVTPDDIANMVLFICSDAGAKVSGQALAVDGNTESLSK